MYVSVKLVNQNCFKYCGERVTAHPVFRLFSTSNIKALKTLMFHSDNLTRSLEINFKNKYCLGKNRLKDFQCFICGILNICFYKPFNQLIKKPLVVVWFKQCRITEY